MTKSCKEIIENAKTLAQIQNSKAFDWRLYINILNGAYTKLYNELTGYSNSFIGYFTFNGKESYLPADCNKILMVYKGTEDNPYIISQSSLNNFIPGTYYIENNYIRIVDKKDSKPVTVKYSKLPVTLTFPEDDEMLDIDVPDNKSIDNCVCTKTGIFYHLSGDPDTTNYFYDFETKETTEIANLPHTSNNFIYFLGKRIRVETENNVTKVIWGSGAEEIDVTEYFLRPNETSLSSVTKIFSDGMHLAISYGAYPQNEVWTMMPDWTKAQVDPNVSKGYRWDVLKVYGICADESTGDYILIGKIPYMEGVSSGTWWQVGGKYYKASFVPDTILDYPNNTFFDVLEDKVAIQLQSLQGLDNSALQTKLQDDEKSFYDSLERSRAPMRIRNEDNRYKWRYF